jgi:hypothetical protein
VFLEVSDERDRRIKRPPELNSVTAAAAADEKTADAFAAVFSRNQAAVEPSDRSPGGIQAPQEVLAALDEIKAILREEFSSLRAQIRSLKRYK